MAIIHQMFKELRNIYAAMTGNAERAEGFEKRVSGSAHTGDETVGFTKHGSRSRTGRWRVWRPQVANGDVLQFLKSGTRPMGRVADAEMDSLGHVFEAAVPSIRSMSARRETAPVPARMPGNPAISCRARRSPTPKSCSTAGRSRWLESMASSHLENFWKSVKPGGFWSHGAGGDSTTCGARSGII